MSTHIDILRVRRALGRDHFGPPRPSGPDGWVMACGCQLAHSVIVSAFSWPDPDGTDVEWVHASLALQARMPDYTELASLKIAVYGDGFAYQQFVPERFHVNIHPVALHLFGRLDGEPAMPYSAAGTI